MAKPALPPLFIAGTGFACAAEALDESYDGTFFRRSDLKRGVQHFYQTKNRFEKLKEAGVSGIERDAKRPHILEVGWEHPVSSRHKDRMGEQMEMFVSADNRLVPIMRINPLTTNGRVFVEHWQKDPASVKKIGISLETKSMQLNSGPTSRVIGKYFTGISLVTKPAHHSTGTFVTHAATSEEELLRQLFDEETRTKNARPIYINKMLRQRIQAATEWSPPANAPVGVVDEGSDGDDDADDVHEEDDASSLLDKEEREDAAAAAAAAAKDTKKVAAAAPPEGDAAGLKGGANDAMDVEKSPPPPLDAPEKPLVENGKIASLPNPAAKVAKQPAKNAASDQKAPAAAESDPMEVDEQSALVFDNPGLSSNKGAGLDKSLSSPSDMASNMQGGGGAPPSGNGGANANTGNTNTNNNNGAQGNGQPQKERPQLNTKNDSLAPSREDLVGTRKRERYVEDEHANNDNDNDDDDAMETDEPQQPPTPRNRAPLQISNRDEKARRTEDASTPGYKYTKADARQQIAAAQEQMNELMNLLGIDTPEARDKYVEGLLQEKAQEAVQQQNAALGAIVTFMKSGNADDGTSQTVARYAKDILDNKPMDMRDMREFVKTIAAAAANTGSHDAQNHLLAEQEYQRQKVNAASELEKTKPIKSVAGVSFISTNGQAPSLGAALASGSGKWGSSFYDRAFSSKGVIVREQPSPYQGLPQQYASPQMQREAAQPQANNFRSTPVGARINNAQHPRVSRGSDDAMDIDESVSEGDMLDKKRRELMRNPDFGFKVMSHIPAQKMHENIPRAMRNELEDALRANSGSDLFKFNEFSDKIEPNGFMHHVFTNIVYPDVSLAGDAKRIEDYSKESRRYDDHKNFTGWIPRVVHGNKPIIVGNDENQPM